MVLAFTGSIPPTQHRQAFVADDLLKQSLATHALMRFHGQKHHAHAILARRGQHEAQPRALRFEKGMRDLNQHTRAVTRLRIASASSPVREVDENLDALLDYVVAFLAGDVRHKSDAAGIVLVARVV